MTRRADAEDLTPSGRRRITTSMSVRLILGRAGSGKTAHCLGAVWDALRVSPLDGPPLILLVPEQASFQIERALVTGVSGAAVHRAQVLSFRRLCQRIFGLYGDGGLHVLSPTGRSMLIRMLLARVRTDLQYFRRVDRFAGFVEQIGRTLSTLIDEAVTPEDLTDSLATDCDDAVLQAKLHDVSLIYHAYLDALGQEYMDPSQELEVARNRLAEHDWLVGANIWVDGFAGFSRQERLMLVSLASRAQHVELAILVDPDAAGDDVSVAGRSADLFARPRRLIGELGELFREHGIPMDQPLELRSRGRRFVRNAALARIESDLFQAIPSGVAPFGDVSVATAADRRTEVEFAVSQIQQFVQRSDQPLRYRDIAIIVRDLEHYDVLLSSALRSRCIPFFIDRRRRTDHHPLVELLRTLVTVAETDYGVAAVRSLLKTGFCPLTDDEADLLENHLLATAVAGRRQWVGPRWSVATRDRRPTGDAAQKAIIGINAAREQLVDAVDAWVVACRDGQAVSGVEWSARFGAVIERLGVRSRIEDWIAEALEEGDLEAAEIHRQVWRDVESLLADLETVLATHRVALGALGSIIDSATVQMSLGLAPPMLDQVLVGSIERSRHPEIKALLLLGLNEGVFPAVAREESILNDDDRTWLDERGVSTGMQRVDRVLDESLLFYIACTRPSDVLIVTHAAADQDGRPLQPSPYLDALTEACPSVSRITVDDPFSGESDWGVLTDRDLAARLAMAMRQRPLLGGATDDPEQRAHWNELYEAARVDESLQSRLSAALRSLVYENSASLSERSVRLLAVDPFTASVSQLETMAACPFKHFAQYHLRLKERTLSQLAAADVGTIHHAILEHFVESLAGRDRSLADLDTTSILEELDRSCREVGEALPVAGELSHARDRYMLARSSSELARVIEMQQRLTRSGSFRPRRAELKFGLDDDAGIPALELTTPAGRRVLLRGVVDRVDLAEVADEMLGVVIDYKRTRDKRLNLADVYHGLSLQLLAYLLVLEQRGETLGGRPVTPIGAFYMSLSAGYTSVDHPDDAEGKQTRTRSHRPRGVFDVSRLSTLDRDTSTGWSPLYAVYRKRDGDLGNVEKSDAADSHSFSALMEHTRIQLGVLADRVLDGEIGVSPYRLGKFSPCRWCSFDTVCRMEPGSTRIRFFESLKRSDVFRLVTNRQGASSDD